MINLITLSNIQLLFNKCSNKLLDGEVLAINEALINVMYRENEFQKVLFRQTPNQPFSYLKMKQ